MSHEFLRSLLAIAAGFLAVAFLVSMATLLLRRFAPAEWSRVESGGSRAAMFANLGGSALFAAVGGCITARLAPSRPLLHALMLAMVLLLLSAVAVFDMRGRYPAIYQAALIAFTSMAALAGGILEVLFR